MSPTASNIRSGNLVGLPQGVPPERARPSAFGSFVSVLPYASDVRSARNLEPEGDDAHNVLGGRAGQFDWLNNRRFIVLGLIDPRRYRPHPHRFGWKRPQQIPRIGFVAEPACVIIRREDQRHGLWRAHHRHDVTVSARPRAQDAETSSSARQRLPFGSRQRSQDLTAIPQTQVNALRRGPHTVSVTGFRLVVRYGGLRCDRPQH
jgi:hypothetical protein